MISESRTPTSVGGSWPGTRARTFSRGSPRMSQTRAEPSAEAVTARVSVGSIAIDVISSSCPTARRTGDRPRTLQCATGAIVTGTHEPLAVGREREGTHQVGMAEKDVGEPADDGGEIPKTYTALSADPVASSVRSGDSALARMVERLSKGPISLPVASSKTRGVPRPLAATTLRCIVRQRQRRRPAGQDLAEQPRAARKLVDDHRPVGRRGCDCAGGDCDAHHLRGEAEAGHSGSVAPDDLHRVRPVVARASQRPSRVNAAVPGTPTPSDAMILPSRSAAASRGLPSFAVPRARAARRAERRASSSSGVASLSAASSASSTLSSGPRRAGTGTTP